MTYQEGEYEAWDDMAVEVEVAEFLYGLVRLLKPELVVETGTGNGYASRYIASALIDNKKGELWTFEADSEFAKTSARKLEEYPVKVIPSPFRASALPACPDLVFLDSGPAYRRQEIDHWLPMNTSLVIHDATRYDLPEDGIMFPGRGLWVRLSR